MQAAIGVLAVVLAALIVWMMVLVSGIQGTARVVNCVALCAAKRSALSKWRLWASGGRNDNERDSRSTVCAGDDKLTLVRLDDKNFQTKMEELASCFESLKQEIYLVREKGFEKTDIIDKKAKGFSAFAMKKPIRKSVFFGGFGAVHHGGHRSFDDADRL